MHLRAFADFATEYAKICLFYRIFVANPPSESTLAQVPCSPRPTFGNAALRVFGALGRRPIPHAGCQAGTIVG